MGKGTIKATFIHSVLKNAVLSDISFLKNNLDHKDYAAKLMTSYITCSSNGSQKTALAEERRHADPLRFLLPNVYWIIF